MITIILGLGWIINIVGWASAGILFLKYFALTFQQGWSLAGYNFKKSIGFLVGGLIDATIVIGVKWLFGDAGSMIEAVASSAVGAIISITFILHRLGYINVVDFLQRLGEKRIMN